jgi:hypothetical protein
VGEDQVEIISIAVAIAPYRKLVEKLVSGELTPLEFEGAYLQARRTTLWMHMGIDVHEVVTDFFNAVDDYCDDPRLRDPAEGDTGPEELLASARELLRRVDNEPDPDRAKYRIGRGHGSA